MKVDIFTVDSPMKDKKPDTMTIMNNLVVMTPINFRMIPMIIDARMGTIINIIKNDVNESMNFEFIKITGSRRH